MLMVIGPWLTVEGLRTFLKMRFIENIPCSKVRSAAMGLVELQGQARPRKLQVSPASQRPCCWWRFKVQEYRKSGKNSRWVTIQDSQSPEPFFLEDNTGRMLIDPIDAELHIPEIILPVDERSPSQFKNHGFFSNKRRLIEQLILEHSPIYVLGEHTHRVNMLEGRRERLNAKLRQAKQDPNTLKVADSNNDGQLDTQEWDKFRQGLEETFLQEEQARADAIPAEERVVVRGSAQTTLIISTRDERSLIRRWLWSAPFMIMGGIGMTGLGVWIAQNTNLPLWLSLGALALGCILSIVLKNKGGISWVWSR